jgi:hypothetical protein
MTEYAPQNLRNLYDRIKLSSKQMSGIVGDSSHTYGYHRGRHYVGPADYSVTLTADKTGDGEAACALDVKLSAADMELATKRLMAACRGNDPRVRCLREFFGTLDGTRVTGWDRHDPAALGDDGYTTSDDSHLWHIHLSIYRSLVLTTAVLQIADVINGIPLPDGPHLREVWPAYMPAGHYFGLYTGPAESHGGFYASERPAVTKIQQRLTKLGYPLVADGRFGPATKAAVAKWQHAKVPGTTRFGEVWRDDWTKLFTY